MVSRRLGTLEAYFLLIPIAVNIQFANRSVFKMSSTLKAELGEEFFPEGTQRVYVSQLFPPRALASPADHVLQGLLGKMPDLVIQAMRQKVWQGIMDHFLR